jgi:hypothetical protein
MGCECWNRTTGVLQHVIIPELQHAKPLIFEPSGPLLVGHTIGMLAAINLDNEMFLEADKIDDVFSDRRLALELRASKAMRAEKIPKPALGIRHITAKRFRPNG